MSVNLKGVLEDHELEECEALCEILNNIRDQKGQLPYGLLPLLNRHTELLTKATRILCAQTAEILARTEKMKIESEAKWNGTVVSIEHTTSR